jgi:hypothetical protein
MAQLNAVEYTRAEKTELKLALANEALRSALEKFCGQQMWYFREKSYEAAENDLRKADRYRGMAAAYEDILAELQSLVKRIS